MKKLLFTPILITAAAFAQTSIPVKGTLTIDGTLSATSATATAPVKSGLSANIPAACIVGDLYYKTDATAGQNLFGCTATNTWTQQAGGGGATISGTDAAVLVKSGSNGVTRTLTGFTNNGTSLDPDGTILSELAGNNTYTGYNDFSGGSMRFPETTYASLPTASGVTGRVYGVTDGSSSACSAGGGSTRCYVVSNGTSWVLFGGSSSLSVTTKGDLQTYSTSAARLAVGSNDQVLTADSTQTTGLKYAFPPNRAIKCYAPAASTTGTTTLTKLFTVTMPTLSAGDMIKAFVIWQHGVGVDTVGATSNVQLKYNDTTNIGANVSIGSASDLGLMTEYMIGITGSSSQIGVSRAYRDAGSHQAMSWTAAGTSESNTTPTLDFYARGANGANDDVMTAAFACVELILAK